jgi:hypothetical protein
MRAQEQQQEQQNDKASSQGRVRRPNPPGPAAALLELQRLAGNAAVARAIEEARHTHDANCGHGPSVQRSAVHQALRSAGRPLDAPLRAEMDPRPTAASTNASTPTIQRACDSCKHSNCDNGSVCKAVGQVAAEVRQYKSPEQHKAKGVRYPDEKIVGKGE